MADLIEKGPFANLGWQMALVFFIVLSNYKEREEEHNDKEREVECGEYKEIFSCLAFVVLRIFSEGYKACEG